MIYHVKRRIKILIFSTPINIYIKFLSYIQFQIRVHVSTYIRMRACAINKPPTRYNKTNRRNVTANCIKKPKLIIANKYTRKNEFNNCYVGLKPKKKKKKKQGCQNKKKHEKKNLTRNFHKAQPIYFAYTLSPHALVAQLFITCHNCNLRTSYILFKIHFTESNFCGLERIEPQ